MKFKIEKGCVLYSKMTALQKKIDAANAEAVAFIKAKGWTGKHYKRQYVLAGGIGAVEFDEKPDGWKTVGAKWQRLYYPKVKGNKELLKEMAALPVVKNDELKEILEYKTAGYVKNGGLVIFTRPSIEWKEEIILLEFPDEINYEPPFGMVEILSSEYKKIKEQGGVEA